MNSRGSVRSKFLKYISNDPDAVAQLKRAGISDDDIAAMQDGDLPPDKAWRVHYKLPLDDNGDNDFSNLVLIKEVPYHRAITQVQSALTRGMQVGDTRTVDFPIPEGIVYPTEP
jgi:hypothetical protein